MGQKITFNPKGLYTNVNELGQIPDGGLLKANNVVISKPGVLQGRRGTTATWFSKGPLIGSAYQPGPIPLKLFNAKLRIGGDAYSGWLGTATPGILSMKNDGTMDWSPDGITYFPVAPLYGQNPIQLSPVDGDRHWYGFEQNGTYYITTTYGMIAVGRPLPNDPNVIQDRRHAGYYPAGVPSGLSMKAEVQAGAGAALQADSQVAYRFCFGYRDENALVHLGAPTTRTTAVNTDVAGTQPRNVKVSTIVPPNIIPGRHFWQLYRSLPSPGMDVDPGDDEGLIYEGQVPTGSVIDEASRTANVVTCRTAAPNEYASGQELRLASDIIGVVGAASTKIFTIISDGSANGDIYEKTGDAGAWTLKSSIPFNLNTHLYVGSIPAEPYQIFKNENTGKLYVIWHKDTTLYVLLADGTYEKSIPIGIMPSRAVLDVTNGVISIFGMEAGSDGNSNPYDYSGQAIPGSLPKYVEFNSNTESVTYSGSTAFVPFNNIGPITDTDIGGGYLGLWKNGRAGTPWIVLCFAAGPTNQPDFTRFEAFCYVSSNKGLSWVQLSFPQVQRNDGSYIAPNFFVNAPVGDTVFNPTNAETTTLIGLSVENYFGSTYGNGATLWKVQSSGLGTPALIHSQFLIYYPNQLAPTSVAESAHGIRAVHTNRTTGITSIFALEANPTLLYKVYHLTTPWTIDQPTAPTSVTVTLPSAYNTGTFIYKPELFDGITSTNLDLTLKVINNLFAEAIAHYTVTTSTATQIDVAQPNVFATAGDIKNGFPSIIVPAGLYTITVIDSTHFRFTYVGSDFPSRVQNVIAEATYISFLDAVGPNYIGPYLYTSTVEEGAINANYPPPLARDATLFRTFAFFANCNQPASLQVTLLQISSDGTINNPGLAYGHTIQVGAGVVTAAATESATARQFKVFNLTNSPTMSLPDRFKNTIDSLSNVVNLNWDYFKNTIISLSQGAIDFASFIVRSIDTIQDVVWQHKEAGLIIQNTFAPYDSVKTSQQEQNVIYYSKSNIADAVPLLNSIRIGQDNKPIRRILAARDSMFIFKDDGCFILRGYGPPWQVDPYDLTLQLAVPASAVVLENSIIGLFTRGVFRVSDSNVELLSLPIQNLLERYMAGDLKSDALLFGFGVADNTDRKYMLWVMEEEPECEACFPARVFAYDTVTQAWTTWTVPAYHCLSFNDERIILISKEQCKLWNKTGQVIYDVIYPVIKNELKTLTRKDLNDGSYHTGPDNQTTVQNHTIDITDSQFIATDWDQVLRRCRMPFNNAVASTALVTEVKKGDLIRLALYSQDNTALNTLAWEAVVLNDAIPGEWIYLSAEIPWTGANPQFVNVLRGIEQEVQFAPNFPGTPAALNHFSEYSISFKEAYWAYFDMLMERPIEATDNVNSVGIVQYDGVAHFGIQSTYFALSDPLSFNIQYRVATRNFIRTYFPRDQQRGTMVLPGYRTRIACYPVEVDGIYVIMTQGSLSFTRR